MDNKICDALEFMESFDSLHRCVLKVIEEAYEKGYSYEEIYTALHKTVDLDMCEWEIKSCL